MKIEYIRQRFLQEGYRITFCNGIYFAKKYQQNYKADSLNGLYKIIFSNKIYI